MVRKVCGCLASRSPDCIGHIATRLGALFVANQDGQGRVVLTKIVLWG